MTKDLVAAECDCGCCEVHFTKDTWDFKDGSETSYSIAVLSSYYDNNPNSLVGRLRRAWGILFGKPVYFNDALLNEDEFDALLIALQKLRDE